MSRVPPELSTKTGERNSFSIMHKHYKQRDIGPSNLLGAALHTSEYFCVIFGEFIPLTSLNTV